MVGPGRFLVFFAAFAAILGWVVHVLHRQSLRLRELPVASMPEAGEMGEELKFLEGQLKSLREENEALTRALSSGMEELPEPVARPGVPTDFKTLVEDVSGIRKLEPETPLNFVPVDVRALEEKFIGTSVGGRAQAEALVAIGFVFDPEFAEVAPAQAGLRANQETTFYDHDRSTLFYRDRPTVREKVVQGITRALIRQNFGQPEAAPNSDAALALRAFVNGDAAQVGLRDQLQRPDGDANPPTAPEEQESFFGAPVYLQERSLFSFNGGSRFVGELHKTGGGWERIDASYARPPQSTAEILHPELYLADPPFTPVEIDLGAPEVLGHPPVWTDVAGELGIILLFKTLALPSNAVAAAEGWAGDRYIVYPGGGYFWKTVWRTPDAAARFFRQMAKFLPTRYGLPAPDASASGSPVMLEQAGRVIRLRPAADGVTVTVTVADDRVSADGIDATFLNL